MKKFRMVRTLVWTLRGIGWLVFVVGIATSLVILISPDILLNYGIQVVYGSIWITALGVVLMSVLYTILFLALAELMLIAISAEENLRKLREFFTQDK